MTLGRSILLVDDDEEFLTILVRRFRRRGMIVVGVSGPDQSLEAARQQHFHVAVVDRSLPGRGGGQLIARLKATHRHLQVIVLSGHGDASSVADALGQGASEYLTKPCGLADLERAINRAMGIPDSA